MGTQAQPAALNCPVIPLNTPLMSQQRYAAWSSFLLAMAKVNPVLHYKKGVALDF
jgi:hypothetical protein